jgi:hypothetical protein
MTVGTSGCNLFGGQISYPPQVEEAFVATIGIPVEPKVHLITEKTRYRRDDTIGIWVENRTSDVLWFTDQWLGLRAYQYDDEGATWRKVDLGSKLGNPQVVSITPGPRDTLPSGDIPVDRIQASGHLRLVITGVTGHGEMFIAYKDIEIVD